MSVEKANGLAVICDSCKRWKFVRGVEQEDEAIKIVVNDYDWKMTQSMSIWDRVLCGSCYIKRSQKQALTTLCTAFIAMDVNCNQALCGEYEEYQLCTIHFSDYKRWCEGADKNYLEVSSLYIYNKTR